MNLQKNIKLKEKDLQILQQADKHVF